MEHGQKPLTIPPCLTFDHRYSLPHTYPHRGFRSHLYVSNQKLGQINSLNSKVPQWGGLDKIFIGISLILGIFAKLIIFQNKICKKYFLLYLREKLRWKKRKLALTAQKMPHRLLKVCGIFDTSCFRKSFCLTDMISAKSFTLDISFFGNWPHKKPVNIKSSEFFTFILK